jgi:hypothetical protein
MTSPASEDLCQKRGFSTTEASWIHSLSSLKYIIIAREFCAIPYSPYISFAHFYRQPENYPVIIAEAILRCLVNALLQLITINGIVSDVFRGHLEGHSSGDVQLCLKSVN